MPDDVTSNRHGGNAESTAARNSLSAGRIEDDCQKITRLAARRHKTGITCDEAEVLLRMSHQDGRRGAGAPHACTSHDHLQDPRLPQSN